MGTGEAAVEVTDMDRVALTRGGGAGVAVIVGTGEAAVEVIVVVGRDRVALIRGGGAGVAVIVVDVGYVVNSFPFMRGGGIVVGMASVGVGSVLLGISCC